MITLRTGNCLNVLRKYPDNHFNVVLTDPPYGMNFLDAHWDKDVPGPDFWREILRVSAPGTPLMAMGGTRTIHYLMTAIEQGGWQIKDLLFWMHGQGFPKSHNVGKAMQKRGMPEDTVDTWMSYGTALKPAVEIIVYAVKPLEGSLADNALKHGVAGLNIDAGRVEGVVGHRSSGGLRLNSLVYGNSNGVRNTTYDKGRWPSHLLHDGSPEVLAAFPESAARFFWSPKPSKREKNAGCEDLPERRKLAADFRPNHTEKAEAGHSGTPYGRFDEVPNNHPTVKPLALFEYLLTLTRPPSGARVLDPFMGSGTTLAACALARVDAVGIDIDPASVEIAEHRVRHWAKQIPGDTFIAVYRNKEMLIVPEDFE